jgi:molybdate transport system substrate-binding protein
MKRHNLKKLSLLFFLIIMSQSLFAAEIRIAVASNFSETLEALAQLFKHQTGHHVLVIPGSTGKLYAQIRNGAPFDAFFSADSQRAERLEQEGFSLPQSRFTYAIGKLVLWSPENDFVDNEGHILMSEDFHHLAIANPKLAPYGKAAYEVLQARNLWKPLKNHLVRGENIGQTYQFVKSGNAQLGFVALSQVKRADSEIEGSFWIVPQSLHQPILQQAVQLKNNSPTTEFLSFVQSDKATTLIQRYGYGVSLAQ